MKKKNRSKLYLVITLMIAFVMAFGCMDAVFAAGGGGGGDNSGSQQLSVNGTYICDGFTTEGTLNDSVAYRGGSISFNVVSGGLKKQWANMEEDVKTYVNAIQVLTEAGDPAGSAVFGEYISTPEQPYYTVIISADSGDFAAGDYKMIFPVGYPVKGNPSAADRALATECTLHFSIAIDAIDISAYTASAVSPAVYNGKAWKPTVTLNGLTADCYSVSWPNAVKTGVYTIVLKGAAPYYKGTKNVGFTIKPAKGKISKLKAGKGKITVKVASQKASGITGYQIAYKKSGTKKWKTVKLSASKTSKVLSKLKKKKKYTVKVRGYKKTSSGTIYGSYSKTKTVKVR